MGASGPLSHNNIVNLHYDPALNHTATLQSCILAKSYSCYCIYNYTIAMHTEN